MVNTFKLITLCLLLFLVPSYGAFGVERPKHVNKQSARVPSQEGTIEKRVQDLNKSVNGLAEQVGNESATKSDEARSALKREIEAAKVRFQELTVSLASVGEQQGKHAISAAGSSLKDLGALLARLGTSLEKSGEQNKKNSSKAVLESSSTIEDDYPEAVEFPDLQD